MPATKDFRRRLLRASLLLDLSRDYKMRDEPEQKRNQTNRGVQSHRDQRLGDSKQPHKALSRESLAPVGSEISGRNARLSGRPETRDRSALGPIRFTLSFLQEFFFTRNQPINKNPIRQHQKNESGTTRQDADSHSHEQACEIKRIARVTKRPLGYQRFRMLCGVVNNFSSQVCRSPRPQSSREKNKQRTGCDYEPGEHYRLRSPAGDRRSNQMPQRDDERNLVERGKAKSNEIDRADDPEPLFELERSRAHESVCSGGCPPLQSAIARSVR